MEDLAYLESLQRIPSPLLLEMERLGDADGVPSVARETGRLLSTLVHAMQANRILEIGTGHGYSTLWMALALPVAGHIWTIDRDSARTQVARTFFERSPRDEAVEIINAPALDVLPTFPVRNLDIVFIDADPGEYADYLGLAVPMLKRSGLVIVDNLLVPARRSLREFARIFLNYPELDSTILPLGYGIGLGARLE